MTDWARCRVAPDGTHHLLDGRPLYEQRYDEVLSFHHPGLAAVRSGREAWHITADGDAAYPQRFLRSFGFYEGRAAVVDRDGWHHVLPNGRPAYAARHAWCGNYQEGRCPVRLAEGHYRHIGVDGPPAYDELWRYAGDYRHGVAVVQAEDGQHTHVDLDGRLVHGRWFFDLDVFHKGFACARDADGWLHVDRAGQPAYERRFAMVEPFYNGQARVELLDGGLEVINELGRAVQELRPAQADEFHALSADMVGYWRTMTLAAAVELGIPEALPAATQEVSLRCGIAADGAARLLGALAELAVVESPGGTWRLTRRGRLLRAKDPESLATAAIEYAGPLLDRWRALPEALRSAHWRPTDIFREVAASPERRTLHHEMLSSYAIHDYGPLVEHLPIHPGDDVVDAGGGSGALAERVAARWPTPRDVRFDLPEVARKASGRPPGESWGGDFFEAWPFQADVVLLARVLHDWDDDRAVQILRRAREALRPGGRLAILEMVLQADGWRGRLCDLHVRAMTGGRERRRADFDLLLATSGFTGGAVCGNDGLVQVLTAAVR